MRLLKETLGTACAGFFFATVGVPVAGALTLDIDDRTESPVYVVDGVPHPFIEDQFPFSFGTQIPGIFANVNVRFIVLEPGSSLVSDILSISVTSEPAAEVPTTFFFELLSDTAGPLTYEPSNIDEVITETGDFQTLYSSPDSTGQNPDLIIRFASDVDPPSIPEPATLTLLGLAFAGIGLARRRK